MTTVTVDTFDDQVTKETLADHLRYIADRIEEGYSSGGIGVATGSWSTTDINDDDGDDNDDE